MHVTAIALSSSRSKTLGPPHCSIGARAVEKFYRFVRYWLIRFARNTDGGTPSEFSAVFGGVTLLNLPNPAATPGYVTHSFYATTSGASTALEFNFRDDPGFIMLDAVVVQAAPAPETGALLGLGLSALWWARRRRPQ